MISTFELQGGKENEYHTTGKQYSCYTDLQNKHGGTVWVSILTAPLSADNLYQGLLKFVLVYPYIKFNNFNVGLPSKV